MNLDNYTEIDLDNIRWMLREAGITLLPDMTGPTSLYVYNGKEHAVAARAIALASDDINPESLYEAISNAAKKDRTRTPLRVALYKLLQRTAPPVSVVMDGKTGEVRMPTDEEREKIEGGKGAWVIRFGLVDTDGMPNQQTFEAFSEKVPFYNK